MLPDELDYLGFESATNLVRNLTYINTLLPPQLHSEKFYECIERSRKMVLDHLEQHSPLKDLFDIADKVSQFSNHSPQPPRRPQPLAPFIQHKSFFNEQSRKALEYFQKLSPTTDLYNAIRRCYTMFLRLELRGLPWKGLGRGEQHKMGQHLRKIIDCSSMSDRALCAIITSYEEFALRVQIALAELGRTLSSSPASIAFLTGFERDLLREDSATQNKDVKKFSSIEKLFRTITFPLPLQDPCGLNEKVQIDDHVELYEFFQSYSQFTDTVIKCSQEQRKLLRLQRIYRQRLLEKVSLLSNEQSIFHYTPRYERNDLENSESDLPGSLDTPQKRLDTLVKAARNDFDSIPKLYTLANPAPFDTIRPFHKKLVEAQEEFDFEADTRELDALIADVRDWPISLFQSNIFLIGHRNVLDDIRTHCLKMPERQQLGKGAGWRTLAQKESVDFCNKQRLHLNQIILPLRHARGLHNLCIAVLDGIIEERLYELFYLAEVGIIATIAENLEQLTLSIRTQFERAIEAHRCSNDQMSEKLDAIAQRIVGCGAAEFVKSYGHLLLADRKTLKETSSDPLPTLATPFPFIIKDLPIAFYEEIALEDFGDLLSFFTTYSEHCKQMAKQVDNFGALLVAYTFENGILCSEMQKFQHLASTYQTALLQND
jgi:hypothetical protein